MGSKKSQGIGTIERPYDILGVGVGPANLALAAAIAERRDTLAPLSTVFIEQKPAISWHPNVQIGDVWMQTPFLKDLATQRDPSSAFSDRL